MSAWMNVERKAASSRVLPGQQSSCELSYSVAIVLFSSRSKVVQYVCPGTRVVRNKETNWRETESALAIHCSSLARI